MSLTINSLPNEVILNIFDYCDNKSLISMGISSKSFRSLINDTNIWSDKLKHEFKLQSVNPMLNYYMLLRTLMDKFTSKYISDVKPTGDMYMFLNINKQPIKIYKQIYDEYHIAVDYIFKRGNERFINDKPKNLEDYGLIFKNPYPTPSYNTYCDDKTFVWNTFPDEYIENIEPFEWSMLDFNLKKILSQGYRFVTFDIIDDNDVEFLVKLGLAKTILLYDQYH